jgi:bacterioferritin (cytochrome b1)
MKMAETHPATTVGEILKQNLKDEKVAVDAYRKILEELKKEKGRGYYDQLLEHEVRHILMEEQEHITELELLLGIQGSSY